MRRTIAIITLVFLLTCLISAYCSGCSTEDAASLFSADKYPLEEGASKFYFSEPLITDVEEPVPVSFTLDGPWDFSQGPGDIPSLVVATFNISTFPKEGLPKEGAIPGATHIEYLASPAQSKYVYVSKDGNGLYEYGVTAWTDGVDTFTCIEPDLLLKFPVRVGDSWQNDFQVYEGEEFMGFVHTTKTVLAKNSIVVPAGTYEDAYMVQEKHFEILGDAPRVFYSYTWYVPNVGEVARIQSLDGELNEVFNQANIFRRLDRYFPSTGEKIEPIPIPGVNEEE